MRIPAAILILLGIILIAVGRHHVRRARKLKTHNAPLPARRRSAAGWSLTFLGFLAMLIGVILW